MDGVWNDMLVPTLNTLCGRAMTAEPTIAELARYILASSSSAKVARMRQKTQWLARKPDAYQRWQAATTMFQFNMVVLKNGHGGVEEQERCGGYALYLAEKTPMHSFTLTQLADLLCARTYNAMNG